MIEFNCDKHKTDAEKDYGNCGYQCGCFSCGRKFIGHKRDITCSLCQRVTEARNIVIDTAERWGRDHADGYIPLMNALKALKAAEEDQSSPSAE